MHAARSGPIHQEASQPTIDAPSRGGTVVGMRNWMNLKRLRDGEGDLVVESAEETCQQAGEGYPEDVFYKKSRKFHGVGIWESAWM
jgi:hypothetical protein